MSTLTDLLDECQRQRETIAAVREYANHYDDHIRKDLLAILDGEVVE